MKSDGLLSEFFCDGISRVIPGLAVIAIYGRSLVKDAFAIFPGASSFGLVIFVFFTAWVIGTIIELFTYRPIEGALVKIGVWKRLVDWLPILKRSVDIGDEEKRQEELADVPIECEIYQDNPTYCRRISKAYSETAMFRCLAAICCPLSIPFLHGIVSSGSGWREQLGAWILSCLLSVVPGAVFLIAWYYSKKTCKDYESQWKKLVAEIKRKRATDGQGGRSW